MASERMKKILAMVRSDLVENGYKPKAAPATAPKKPEPKKEAPKKETPKRRTDDDGDDDSPPWNDD